MSKVLRSTLVWTSFIRSNRKQDGGQTKFSVLIYRKQKEEKTVKNCSLLNSFNSSFI